MKQGIVIIMLFFASSGAALAQQPPRPAYPAPPITAETIPGCGTIHTLPQLRVCLKRQQLRQVHRAGKIFFPTPGHRQGKFWHGG